jgi:hypothetical protein
VTIEALFTLVNVGIAARATARFPLRQILAKFGINRRSKASFKYSSEDPSKQIATNGRAGHRYVLPLQVNSALALTCSLLNNASPLNSRLQSQAIKPLPRCRLRIRKILFPTAPRKHKRLHPFARVKGFARF